MRRLLLLALVVVPTLGFAPAPLAPRPATSVTAESSDSPARRAAEALAPAAAAAAALLGVAAAASASMDVDAVSSVLPHLDSASSVILGSTDEAMARLSAKAGLGDQSGMAAAAVPAAKAAATKAAAAAKAANLAAAKATAATNAANLKAAKASAAAAKAASAKGGASVKGASASTKAGGKAAFGKTKAAGTTAAIAPVAAINGPAKLAEMQASLKEAAAASPRMDIPLPDAAALRAAAKANPIGAEQAAQVDAFRETVLEPNVQAGTAAAGTAAAKATTATTAAATDAALASKRAADQLASAGTQAGTAFASKGAAAQAAAQAKIDAAAQRNLAATNLGDVAKGLQDAAASATKRRDPAPPIRYAAPAVNLEGMANGLVKALGPGPAIAAAGLAGSFVGAATATGQAQETRVEVARKEGFASRNDEVKGIEAAKADVEVAKAALAARVSKLETDLAAAKAATETAEAKVTSVTEAATAEKAAAAAQHEADLKAKAAVPAKVAVAVGGGGGGGNGNGNGGFTMPTFSLPKAEPNPEAAKKAVMKKAVAKPVVVRPKAPSYSNGDDASGASSSFGDQFSDWGAALQKNFEGLSSWADDFETTTGGTGGGGTGGGARAAHPEAAQSALEADPYYDTSNIPINTYKNKEPFVGKVVSVKRIVGPKATGETCDVVIDHQGMMPYWEGQSFGVIPPGTNPKNGKPNVRSALSARCR